MQSKALLRCMSLLPAFIKRPHKYSVLFAEAPRKIRRAVWLVTAYQNVVSLG